MKTALILLLPMFLTGCFFAKYQSPFSVEDPSVKGEQLFASGSMISATKLRYWQSYKYALEKGGYKTDKSKEFPGFITTGIINPTSDIEANYQFWKEGQSYAKSLCSDFFRRISLAKAHRDNAQKQTNIAGGIVTAGMGLAGSPATSVGAAGLLFSGAEASFDAYDSSYLVTPDLGLMQGLVRAVQETTSAKINKNNLIYVSDVLVALNEYVYPCTFTGMQALLDNSLNKRISDFPEYVPFNYQGTSKPNLPAAE